jgi:hypothetical protein
MGISSWWLGLLVRGLEEAGRVRLDWLIYSVVQVYGRGRYPFLCFTSGTHVQMMNSMCLGLASGIKESSGWPHKLMTILLTQKAGIELHGHSATPQVTDMEWWLEFGG